MKIGISDEAVTFIVETAYEGVHVLYAAMKTAQSYEGDRVAIPIDDLGTLKKFCEALWDHQPALARQHFQSLTREIRARRTRKIGYGNN